MKRYLRAFFIFLRIPGFVPDLEWTHADAIALASFLRTPAGCKLRLALQSFIASANQRAAWKANAFECGQAVGFHALHSHLLALSAQQEESPASEDQVPFGASGLEHLAP